MHLEPMVIFGRAIAKFFDRNNARSTYISGNENRDNTSSRSSLRTRTRYGTGLMVVSMTRFPATGEIARPTVPTGISTLRLHATRPITLYTAGFPHRIRVSLSLKPTQPMRLLILTAFLKRSMFMRAKTWVNSLLSGLLVAKSKGKLQIQDLQLARLTVLGS